MEQTKVSGRKFYKPEELICPAGPIPMSRSGIYNAIKNGDIKSIKIGRRILVPTWAVEELFNQARENVQQAN